MPSRSGLKKIVAALEKVYGKPEPFPSTDPWELILRENASYLVDDAAREEVFRSLKARVGIAPEAILGAPTERLVEAIGKGGPTRTACASSCGWVTRGKTRATRRRIAPRPGDLPPVRAALRDLPALEGLRIRERG